MRRLAGLDGLRGSAALAVVLFHAVIVLAFAPADWQHPLSEGLYMFGWTGVDLFFVVSGFLLALPFMAPTRTHQPWTVYATKRLARIAPPYYATILLTTLFLGTRPEFGATLTEGIRHVVYAHNFFPESVLAMNGVFWTLAIEMQFYLVLPLVVPLFRSRHWPIGLALAAIIALAWRYVFYAGADHHSTFWMTAQVPAFALHFALGMAAAKVHADGFRLPRGDIVAAAAIALFVVLPIFAFDGALLFFAAGDHASSMFVRPLVAVGYTFLVLAVVSERGRLADIFAARPLQALGAQSYSLYLVHYPVQVGLTMAVPAVLGLPIPTFIVVASAASVLVAAVFYRAIERPSLGAKERLAAAVSAWSERAAARRATVIRPVAHAPPAPAEA